jgi:hypothetical protein
MTVQTLMIGKREFVLVPKRDFERIAAQARRQDEQDRQDAGDVAESRRRMKEPGGVGAKAERSRRVWRNRIYYPGTLHITQISEGPMC